MYRSDDNTRTIVSTQRYGIDLPLTTLNLDGNTGILTTAGTTPQPKQDHIRTEILNALGSQTLTESEIRACVRGNQTNTAKALRELVDDGTVERSGGGLKGNPYRYCRADTPEMADSRLTLMQESTIENESDVLCETAI